MVELARYKSCLMVIAEPGPPSNCEYMYRYASTPYRTDPLSLKELDLKFGRHDSDVYCCCRLMWSWIPNSELNLLDQGGLYRNYYQLKFPYSNLDPKRQGPYCSGYSNRKWYSWDDSRMGKSYDEENMLIRPGTESVRQSTKCTALHIVDRSFRICQTIVGTSR